MRSVFRCVRETVCYNWIVDCKTTSRQTIREIDDLAVDYVDATWNEIGHALDNSIYLSYYFPKHKDESQRR